VRYKPSCKKSYKTQLSIIAVKLLKVNNEIFMIFFRTKNVIIITRKPWNGNPDLRQTNEDIVPEE